MSKTQMPVGVRDIYSTNIHSCLESWDDLVEGFSSIEGFSREQRTEEKIMHEIEKEVKKDTYELNKAATGYYKLKNFIERDVQPEVDLLYSTPSESKLLENESQRSLKTQFQDDSRSMIEGTSNLLIITGVAFTTVTVFAIIASM